MSHKDLLATGFVPTDIQPTLSRKGVSPALLGAGTLIGAGVGWATAAGGINAGINAITNPSNAPYAGGDLGPVLAQVVAYAGIGVANSWITSKIIEAYGKNQAEKDRIMALLQQGELKLLPNPGHLAVFAGNGDAICSQVIKPYSLDQAVIYGHTKDAAGGRPIWVKTATPDASASQTLFGKSLEIGGLASAGHILLSASNEQQLFLPDPNNPAHHDMSFEQIRAMLLRLRQANARANITLVADRMLGEHILSNDSVDRQHITLDEYVTQLNAQEGANGKITLIDPTDVVIAHLASEGFNPNRLPIRLVSTAVGIAEYAQRFGDRISRHRTANNILRLANSDDGDALRVSYGTSGLATAIPTDSPQVTHGLAVGDEGSVFGPNTTNVSIADIVTKAISQEINRAVPFESVQQPRGSGTIFSFARDIIHGPRSGNRRSG